MLSSLMVGVIVRLGTVVDLQFQLKLNLPPSFYMMGDSVWKILTCSEWTTGLLKSIELCGAVGVITALLLCLLLKKLLDWNTLLLLPLYRRWLYPGWRGPASSLWPQMKVQTSAEGLKTKAGFSYMHMNSLFFLNAMLFILTLYFYFIHPFVSAVYLQRQQFQQKSPRFPFPCIGHRDPEAFPGRRRHTICPLGSEAARGLVPAECAWKVPIPPQLARINTQEQRLYSKSLTDNWTSQL